MTWIFLSPAASRMTSNSSCSSTSASAAAAPPAPAPRRPPRPGPRPDVEGLLELLDEVRQLEEGHLLERVEQVVGAELRHGGHSSVDGLVARGGSAAAGSSLGVSAGTWSVADSAVSAGAVPRRRRRPAPWRRPRLPAWPGARPASRAIWTGSALSVAAAFAIDAFMAPASMASSTSRDSRSASRSISDGLIGLAVDDPALDHQGRVGLGEVAQSLGRLDHVALDEGDRRRPAEQPFQLRRDARLGRRELGQGVLDHAERRLLAERTAQLGRAGPRSGPGTRPARRRWSSGTARSARRPRPPSPPSPWASFPGPVGPCLGKRHQPRPASARGPAKRNAPARGTRAWTPSAPRKGQSGASARTPARAARNRGSFGHPVPGTRRRPTVFGCGQSTGSHARPCPRQLTRRRMPVATAPARRVPSDRAPCAGGRRLAVRRGLSRGLEVVGEAAGLAGVDRDARAHRGGQGDLPAGTGPWPPTASAAGSRRWRRRSSPPAPRR